MLAAGIARGSGLWIRQEEGRCDGRGVARPVESESPSPHRTAPKVKLAFAVSRHPWLATPLPPT
jgi:hypothetical protein